MILDARAIHVVRRGMMLLQPCSVFSISMPSGEEVAGQGLKIERDDGKLDIGLEGFEARPSATVQPEGPFGGGDEPFDASAPFTQALVHPYARDQFGKFVAFRAGKCDVRNPHAAGLCRVKLAGEAAVGADAFWGAAKAVPVAFEGGDKLFGIGGVPASNAAIENEVAFTGRENHFMPVDYFPLSLLDNVGMLFENGKDFFVGRYSFAFDNAAFGLRDNGLGQRDDVIEFIDECEGEERVLGGEAPLRMECFDGLASVRDDLARELYHPPIQFLAVLCPPDVIEFVAQSFGGAGVVAEASMQAGHFGFHAPQDARDHPDRIPQLFRIDGVMDVARDGAGVHADLHTFLDFLIARILDDGVVDAYERGRAQLLYVLLERGERGDFSKRKIAELPQRDGVIDAIMQLAITEPFAHLDDAEAQDLACGHSLRAGVLLGRAVFLDAQIAPHHRGDVRIGLQDFSYFVPLFFARSLGMLKAQGGLWVRNQAHSLTFLVVVSGISANLVLLLVVYQKHRILSRGKCA
jgi:hypothetical protein